jgi:hypothetical protein
MCVLEGFSEALTSCSRSATQPPSSPNQMPVTSAILKDLIFTYTYV